MPGAQRGCAGRSPSEPHPATASHPAGIRAYEQLGYRAFGTPGKMAAAIAITLQNIGGEDGAGGHPLALRVRDGAGAHGVTSLRPTAMSSYLYIVKSEVPLVIQTFLNLEEKTT